jgi:hypothetical protein
VHIEPFLNYSFERVGIMKVYELIEELKKMPQFNVIKLDDGEYVNDVEEVELDDRGYVIIRPM